MLEQYVIVKAIKEVTSKPNEVFSVRGLASKLDISVGAAKTALDFIRERGIAKLSVVGNTHQHKANLESALCRQWKILFNLDELEKAKIVEQLLEKVAGIQSILLYGSFARGTNDEKSDIDLLVITQKPEKLAPVQAKLARELNISLLSFAEWKKKALVDKVFYENVILDSVVLFGNNRPVVL